MRMCITYIIGNDRDFIYKAEDGKHKAAQIKPTQL